MIKQVVRTIAGLTTSAGVGQVIANIVKSTTPDDLNQSRKVMTMIGGGVTSMILGGLASTYVEKQFDDFMNNIKPQEKY